MKVRSKNYELVLDFVTEFTHGGKDYLVLVCSDGIPRTFYKEDWVEFKEPLTREQAAEEVCRAVQKYYRLDGTWQSVDTAMKAWEAL